MGPDPSSDVCPDCLHPRDQHVVDGCCARDNLGNRCPCVQPAYW